jgi:predicted Zn-dependent peptidase
MAPRRPQNPWPTDAVVAQLHPGLQKAGVTRTLAVEGDGLVRRTVLPSGLRVITEQMPAVRSVAFGIWIGVGSRDETAALSGVSHYLEHLLFKGTRSRDALAIAAAMDAVGGELNAYTTKEYTCYYARVLADDLPLAVDVVTDMVTRSLLRAGDVESERSVILEEIAMHDDDPGDLVHDVFTQTAWPEAALGRPVLGTVESIRSLGRTGIVGYYHRRYRPDRLVVAAAGCVDHGRLLRLVRNAFGAATGAEGPPAPPRRPGRPPEFQAGVQVVRRPTEQANVVLGMSGVCRTDPRRFALGVLNGAVGAGMSSRLFQEVRERRGLAYSVYSFSSQYADGGLFGVYAGCLPGKTREVLELSRDELQRVAAHGITAAELDRGKGQLEGGFVLGLEDTGSRMSRLGKAELVYGELLSVGEVLDRIEAVTLDDVQAVATDVLTGPLSLAVVGPFDDEDFSAVVA